MFKRTSTPSKSIHTNLKKDFDQILTCTNKLNDHDFEKYVQVYAPDSYWKILAERARIQLEDQLQENRQLYELLDELNKENQQLQIKCEQCEQLTNLFNSILPDYDSGIDLQYLNESPIRKRQTKHVTSDISSSK